MIKEDQGKLYQDREVSWLAFNERVLQEAADDTVPVLERLKFLSIFSSNLDEFFRVRVASLRRLLKVGKKDLLPMQHAPAVVIDLIQKKVLHQQIKFNETYQNIIEKLEGENIFIVDEKTLTTEQTKEVREYFTNSVLPFLFPIIMDEKYELPLLKDKSLYQVVSMDTQNNSSKSIYALFELPTDVISRFYLIKAGAKNATHIILLDDVIRSSMDLLFSIFDYDEFHSFTIKITRDAELDLDSDLTKSLLDIMQQSLKSRKKGALTRLVYDERIPVEMLTYLINKLKVSTRSLIPGGRYHNYKDFFDFPVIKNKALYNQPLQQARIESIDKSKTMFAAISQRDYILYHPFHSFDYIIRLLREAAIDPSVRVIKITLYRVAKHSSIVHALINAIKNGAKVYAWMELQARFDEESNIYWAKKLEEAGASVFYGKSGQKIHCKMCLISRKEGEEIINYGHLSTGNYNRITGKLYCDFGLLTVNPEVIADMNAMFKMLQKPEKPAKTKHIMAAPHNLKLFFLGKIEHETLLAQEGKKAYITAKMNSLVDKDIIDKLYEASKAGVKINLIIRGICCLVPGIAGLSENISVVSIIDRLLEHTRVFIFGNDGNEIIYLSSADWMTRNLENRIEAAFPILDSNCCKIVKDIINLQLSDNVKARIIDQNLDNHYKNGGKKPVRSQIAIAKYLASLKQ
ncbi:MAG: polyphosphate kinase 1 [Bacteroidota bacterium]|nr:polyphosphate kinase 1 [Bacteroidota bacterium]